MKKLLVLNIFICFVALNIFGQEANYCQFSKKADTPLRHKYLIKPLVNKGKAGTMDIQKTIDKAFAESFKPYGGGNKKFNNVNSWSQQEFFIPVKNAAEADVVITGTYKAVKETMVDEKKFQEKGNNFNSPVTYFEARSVNKADMLVILNFKYKNGTSVNDTIQKSFTSERKKGKTITSLDDMEEKSLKHLESSLNKYFWVIDREQAWFKFPKVKIKDKALKEDFKAAKQLANDGKIVELGQLYRKIYEAEKQNEAFIAIGMCFELLGNYQKANEYYKNFNDFETKTRMKSQVAALEYLQTLGFKPEFVDF